MWTPETLRREAAEMRRLAREQADQSDAFLHLVRAIELEAMADEVVACGPPTARSATGPTKDCNPE
jgi:hypothetical protein